MIAVGNELITEIPNTWKVGRIVNGTITIYIEGLTSEVPLARFSDFALKQLRGVFLAKIYRGVRGRWQLFDDIAAVNETLDNRTNERSTE